MKTRIKMDSVGPLRLAQMDTYVRFYTRPLSREERWECMQEGAALDVVAGTSWSESECVLFDDLSIARYETRWMTWGFGPSIWPILLEGEQTTASMAFKMKWS